MMPLATSHWGPQLAYKDGLSIIQCVECGYAHLSPLPTQAELYKLYADEYYQSYNTGWFEKERREQWYWQKVYRQRLDYASGLYNDLCYVVDYGAGYGWFVRSAWQWRTGICPFGVEPNEAARIRGKKEVVFDIEDITHFPRILQEEFVHLSLVLEHLLNPLDLLLHIRDGLRANGIICIIVPNEFNPLQRRLKGYTSLHPHHVNYFTPESLTRLVEKAGFEVVRQTATFPIEWLALHGLPYHKYPKFGILAHWLRMVIEYTALSVAPDWWEKRRDKWASMSIGREVELWVRKSG